MRDPGSPGTLSLALSLCGGRGNIAISRRRFLGLAGSVVAGLSPISALAAKAAAPLPTYFLPYPNAFVWQCVQGNNSGGSHSGRAAWAWDFRMPQGSPIMAARDGVVSMLKQDSDKSCPQNIYSCPDWNNYIVIDHGDGSSAAYLHGFVNGARVRLGQQVKQGDLIGISGTTGQSGGPHLHFQVQYTTPGAYIAQSFPVGFAEVTGNAGVPVRRGTYRSANTHAADFDIRAGHFYTQSNGTGIAGHGFSVTDESGVPMWSTYLGGGGPATIGYPLSRRFGSGDGVYQIFQRQVFAWSNSQKQIQAINISELPAAPIDGENWLRTQSAISLDKDFSASDAAWASYVATQQAFLDGQPRMKEVYFSLDDPVNRFGLPLGPATESQNGFGIGLRLTHASFSISKRDSPFAKAGELTVSNGGDLVLDAEPFSRHVFEPEPLFPEQSIAMVVPPPAA